MRDALGADNYPPTFCAAVKAVPRCRKSRTCLHLPVSLRYPPHEWSHSIQRGTP